MNQLRCFSFYVEGGENTENELKAVDGEILWDMEFDAQLFLHQGAVAPGCVYPGWRIEDRQVVDGTGLGR